MSDLDQIRRNVQVMDLLTESFEAHERGDREAFERAHAQALDCDAAAVSVLQGGMLIGEVPRPDEDLDLWLEYVEANREKLARAEAEQEAEDA